MTQGALFDYGSIDTINMSHALGHNNCTGDFISHASVPREEGKKYKQANKEKISEKGKEYRQANKEKIKEKKKEYRQANKENIHCECGSSFSRLNKNRHLKSQKHCNYIKNKDT